MIDVPLLRKVADWVDEQAALPIRASAWSQMNWVVEGRTIGRTECGTAYCVAGYVGNVLSDYACASDTQTWVVTERGEEHVSDVAACMIGLPIDVLNRQLFSGINSAAEVRSWCEIYAERAGEKL